MLYHFNELFVEGFFLLIFIFDKTMSELSINFILSSQTNKVLMLFGVAWQIVVATSVQTTVKKLLQCP